MITSDTLRKLTELNLSPEQMTGVLNILADDLAREEERKRNEAKRTRLYRQRGGGSIPEEMRAAVMRRDKETCQECGSLDYPQIDHIHPVSKGGQTVEENLQVLCRPCNARKKDRIRKNSNGISTGISRGNSLEVENISSHIENARAPDSLFLPSEVIKKERKKVSKNTASRFSLDALPPEWESFCHLNRPDLDPQNTFDAFRDWWTAAPGGKGLKADWAATWRTWVRNQKNFNGNGHAKPRDKHQQILDAAAEALRDHRAAAGEYSG